MKPLNYNQLKPMYKKAVYQYMRVDGDGNLNDFKYLCSTILTSKLIKRIKENYDNNFESYHKRYMKKFKTYRERFDKKWAIILDDNNVIEDGWHRFHIYVKKNMKKIPCITLIARGK